MRPRLRIYADLIKEIIFFLPTPLDNGFPAAYRHGFLALHVFLVLKVQEVHDEEELADVPGGCDVAPED